MYRQKLTPGREFALKIENMPLLVEPETFSPLISLTIMMFFAISLFFITDAAGQRHNYYFWLLSLGSMSLLVYAFLYDRETLCLGSSEITCQRRGSFFVPGMSWNQPIKNYCQITGKRYYSLSEDRPALIREVILRHAESRRYDVVVARFVCDDPEDLETAIAWQNHWHKACIVFSLPAVDQVDGNARNIDLAEIAAAIW
jgi:hypothetical protein